MRSADAVRAVPRRAARGQPNRSLPSCSSGPTGVGKTELAKALAEMVSAMRTP
ncbi:hypothetical protein ACPA9J_32750 [Pseudomonas aeruginosa]